MKRILIEFIPHEQQRYETLGDWLIDEASGDITIRVSETPDWRDKCLVAIHELAEVLLCKQSGVTQQMVDKFDMEFEANRQEGDDSEPGDCVAAPYVQEHCVASGIERIMCAGLARAWIDYENALNEVS